MPPISNHTQLGSRQENFGVYSPLIDFKIPNFLNIQRASFKYFLTQGLIKEFNNIKTIVTSDQSFEIYFYANKYKISPPKWTPSQAILKRKTYACSLYLPVQVTDYKTKQTSFHWIKLANLPMMTKYGHFIINGCPRIIINQIVRSPGVYFKKESKDNNKTFYCADFIASRGAWLRLEVDKDGEIWAKLKRSPQIPIVVFLRCLGLNFGVLSNYLDFTKHFNSIDFESIDRLEHQGLNLFLSPEEALTQLSTIVYPNLVPTSTNGQVFLFRKFLNPRTYTMSSLGRARLNQKLGLCIPEDCFVLTGQDVLFACLYLIDLVKNIKKPDDIDDLQNRKIQPCGELIQNQLAIGLIRLEKSMRQQYKQIPYKKLTLSHLLNVSPINSALKDFFGTNPLSQMMDQTNALAELTHKRRLSCLGPGGIQPDTASMAIRGIHPTHYGRICPIETPEGKNAGLVNSITIYAYLNTNGFLETPFWKMYKGLILNTHDPLLFDSKQEGNFTIAPGDICKTALNFLPKNGLIPSRKIKQFQRVSRTNMNYIAMSPIQMISVATSLIPFLEHDDGNRALMGSNMQRQAVPTIRPTKPIVATGLESRVVSDIGYGLQAKKSGFVSYVDGNKILIYSTFSKVQKQKEVKAEASKQTNLKLNQSFSSICIDHSQVEKDHSPDRIAKKLTKAQFIDKFQSFSLFKNRPGHLPSLAWKVGPFKTSMIPVVNHSSIDSESFLAGTKDLIVSKVTSIYSTQQSIQQRNDKISPLRLNSSQFGFVYNRLFTNNFSGRVEFFNLFSRKAILCQKDNNWKPILSPGHNRFLQSTGNQIVFQNYSKSLLSKLYPIQSQFLTEPHIGVAPKFQTEFFKRHRFIFPPEKISDIHLSGLISKIRFAPQKGSKASNDFSFGESRSQVDLKNYLKTPLNPEFYWSNTPLESLTTKGQIQLVPSQKPRDFNFNFFKNKNQTWQDIEIPQESSLSQPRIELNKNHLNFSNKQSQINLKPLDCSNSNSETELVQIQYDLDKFHGSNQDTCMVHRPTVFEGQWVEKGDILADNSSSQQGELAIGQNLLIGYTPWEGYNFEDAVLISQRLIHDELYTSLHIERYEVDIRDTEFGMEQIKCRPETNLETDYLDQRGIVKIGTWVEPGDVLVNKITPIGQKPLTPYEKLLYDIVEKKIPTTRNTSLRVPKNVFGRVIHVELVEPEFKVDDRLSKNKSQSLENKQSIEINDQNLLAAIPISRQRCEQSHFSNPGFAFSDEGSQAEEAKVQKLKQLKQFLITTKSVRHSVISHKIKAKFPHERKSNQMKHNQFQLDLKSVLESQMTQLTLDKMDLTTLKKSNLPLSQKSIHIGKKAKQEKVNYQSGPLKVYVYLAEKRAIQVGDKIAGRHGNKGIVSNILPIQDMPYLPDGTALDLVFNPLGVPSRMNVGQIFECLLGLAGSYLGQNYKIQPFDELYGCEASRSLVYSKLYEARIKTGQNWLFQPNNPGKIRLFDGRTGECFKQPVTVGRSYILKLIHLVDEKIHARSTGPYSLVTQQPLRGKSKMGGQRVGEMEVWALEGFGAAYILQEILTIKSDAMHGREKLLHAILENQPMEIGTPESFKVLIRELQSACLDMYCSQVVGPFGQRAQVDIAKLP